MVSETQMIETLRVGAFRKVMFEARARASSKTCELWSSYRPQNFSSQSNLECFSVRYDTIQGSSATRTATAEQKQVLFVHHIPLAFRLHA
jgi:hypothetical protein